MRITRFTCELEIGESGRPHWDFQRFLLVVLNMHFFLFSLFFRVQFPLRYGMARADSPKPTEWVKF